MVWASWLLITLAVARITRLVTLDRILLFLRRWVVNKYGEESLISYLVHCSWCSSIWIALPASIAWALLLLPLHLWWLALPSWFATSYLAGLLSQLEER